MFVARLLRRAYSIKYPKVINEPTVSVPSITCRNHLRPVHLSATCCKIFTEKSAKQVVCADYSQSLCNYSVADRALTEQAIAGALSAKESWERWPLADRSAVFLKAAALASSPAHRYRLLAATMLGQGKTAWQAEIDAVTELCDFWRFNVKFAQDCEQFLQPEGEAKDSWNWSELRSLEGFVYAISPFNFTAIGGNLASAPALMGNCVVWKPSSSAILSNFLIYEVLEEAGLPPGVIQFIPGPAQPITTACIASPELAGIHFTGSTSVFRSLWRQVASNIDHYRSFPRLVGETGGKNFHVVHESADISNVVNSTIRSAFEYQGQKCSACSRLFIPKAMWGDVKPLLVKAMGEMTIARAPNDLLSTFLGPVVSREALDKIIGFIERAKQAGLTVTGGDVIGDAKGFAITPALIECKSIEDECLNEEIFGPVLAVYQLSGSWEDSLNLINKHSKYGLTGSVFSKDRPAISKAMDALRHSAGNVYINEKSSGAVVGQQPFGGARASGTNDKAGSPLNLLRWTSPRTVKEQFNLLEHWSYPHVLK